MTFFFTLLFMILVFWRPQEWLLPWMYGWPLLDVVTWLALLAMLAEMGSGQRFRIKWNDPPIIGLIGLWVATVLSHVSHTYFAGLIATYPETFKFCFFPVLLILVLDRPRRFRIVAWMFVAMTCFMAVNSLLQDTRGYGFAGHYPVWSHRPGYEGYIARSRFFGIFHDPNDLAQILVASMPFALVLFRKHGVLSLLAGGGVIAILLRAFVTTYSRGGQVALAAAIAMASLLLLPRKVQPFVAIIGSLAALVLIPVMIGWLDLSARERFIFWGYGNWAFLKYPLFGVGYKMLGEYIPGGRATHNAFVTCYAEIGLFGYWFWMSLIYYAYAAAWRTRDALTGLSDPEARWLRRFCAMGMAGLTGYLASSYFLSRAFHFPLFFLVAILSATPKVAMPYIAAAGRKIPIQRLRWVQISLYTIGSILYLYVSILLLNRLWGQ
jgi:putative inorganic carbon (hco3(-)) transporter